MGPGRAAGAVRIPVGSQGRFERNVFFLWLHTMRCQFEFMDYGTSNAILLRLVKQIHPNQIRHQQGYSRNIGHITGNSERRGEAGGQQV